jgi:hypothetical protein
LCEKCTHRSEPLGGDHALTSVGVKWRAVTVRCDLQAAVFQVRDAIDFIAKVNPDRHQRRRKTSVTRVNTEKEDLLARRVNAVFQQVGEELG